MNRQFAMCVLNQGYEVSLEKGNVYPLVSDASSVSQSMVRVVEESGEDYLFPKACSGYGFEHNRSSLACEIIVAISNCWM